MNCNASIPGGKVLKSGDCLGMFDDADSISQNIQRLSGPGQAVVEYQAGKSFYFFSECVYSYTTHTHTELSVKGGEGERGRGRDGTKRGCTEEGEERPKRGCTIIIYIIYILGMRTRIFCPAPASQCVNSPTKAACARALLTAHKARLPTNLRARRKLTFPKRD